MTHPAKRPSAKSPTKGPGAAALTDSPFWGETDLSALSLAKRLSVTAEPPSLDLNCVADDAKVRFGKGRTMTDNNDFEDTANEAGAEKKPEEPDLRGRYVSGDYGTAGVERGRHADDEEGQYIGGDYGEAGSEGGLPEPLGSKAKESGRYVEADLGDAGTIPGRTAESEIGRYSEGDYGTDGRVDPLRKSGTESDTDTGKDSQQ